MYESIGPDFLFLSWRYLWSMEEFFLIQYFMCERGESFIISKGVLKRNWKWLGNLWDIEYSFSILEMREHLIILWGSPLIWADLSFHLLWAYFSIANLDCLIHLILLFIVVWSRFGSADVDHLSDHLPSQRWNHPILFCWCASGLYSGGRIWGSTKYEPDEDHSSPLHKRDDSPGSVDLETESSRFRRVCSVFCGYSSHERKCGRVSGCLPHTAHRGEGHIFLSEESHWAEASGGSMKRRWFSRRMSSFCGGSWVCQWWRWLHYPMSICFKDNFHSSPLAISGQYIFWVVWWFVPLHARERL